MSANPVHELFARLLSEGKSAAASYRAAYPKASAATAETEGPALARKPEVNLRLQELQAMASRIAEEELAFGKKEALSFLAGIIRTPIGQVDANSGLCQKLTRIRRSKGGGGEAEEWETEKVEMPGKIEAVREMAKLCGWYAPERLEVKTALPPEYHEQLKQIFKPRPAA